MSLLGCALLMIAASSGEGSTAPKTDQAGDRGKGLTLPFLLAGLRDNNDRIRSGVVRVQGRKLDDDPKGGRLEGEIRLFIAFDQEHGLFRFDRTEPGRAEPRPGDPPTPPGTAPSRSFGGKFARTPEGTIYRLDGDASINMGTLQKDPPAVVSPFDPRAIGLYYYSDFERNVPLDTVIKSWDRGDAIEVVREADGLYRLRRVDEGPISSRTTIWLDTERGYTPIRLETNDKKTGSDDWSDAITLSQTTYQKLGNVWVPKTYHIDDRQFHPRLLAYDLVFEWESVNEPVDPKLFTVEGFDAPKGTYVVDRRIGRPIAVGVVGEPRAEPPVFAVRHPEGERSTFRRSRTWVAFILVQVLLLLGYLIWARTRRGGRQS